MRAALPSVRLALLAAALSPACSSAPGPAGPVGPEVARPDASGPLNNHPVQGSDVGFGSRRDAAQAQDVGRDAVLGSDVAKDRDSGTTKPATDASFPAFNPIDVPKIPTQTTPYTNPLSGYDFADPAALVVNNVFYAYSTQGPRGNIQVLSATDPAHWIDRGDALPRRPGWATDTSWAPHVSAADGKFFLYFSAGQRSASSDFCMGAAIATAPQGPFVPVEKPVLCDTGILAIDSMAFDDPVSGKHYMYWGSGGGGIKVKELAADRVSLKDSKPPTVVLPAGGGEYEALIEGPWVIKRGRYYYLFYSGDDCCGTEPFHPRFFPHYATMVARSSSPLGPFIKQKTPVLVANGAFDGPGHNSIITDAAGYDWIIYHAVDTRFRTDNGFLRRPMMMDPIIWTADAWPTVANGQPSGGHSKGPAFPK